MAKTFEETPDKDVATQLRRAVHSTAKNIYEAYKGEVLNLNFDSDAYQYMIKNAPRVMHKDFLDDFHKFFTRKYEQNDFLNTLFAIGFLGCIEEDTPARKVYQKFNIPTCILNCTLTLPVSEYYFIHPVVEGAMQNRESDVTVGNGLPVHKKMNRFDNEKL